MSNSVVSMPMKTYEDAQVRQLMVQIALPIRNNSIYYRYEPAFRPAIGNTIEVIEAAEILKGRGMGFILTVPRTATEMMFLAKVEDNKEKAKERLKEV